MPHYVRAGKAAMGLLGHEIFVPQSYQFGGEAQVDWYEGWVEFDGEARKTYVFCLRSMASGRAFHRAWPRSIFFTALFSCRNAKHETRHQNRQKPARALPETLADWRADKEMYSTLISGRRRRISPASSRPFI